MLAMLIGMSFLAWIMIVLLYKGFGALSLSLFTQSTPAPGSDGGLFNAILGSLMMVGVSTFIATPIGILAGVYLSEFGRKGWFADATRFVNDIHAVCPVDRYSVCSSTRSRLHGAALFGLGRLNRPVADRHPGRRAHHREHAQPGARQPARSRLRAWGAALEGQHVVTLRVGQGGVVTGCCLQSRG
jgi:hypothetical protein